MTLISYPRAAPGERWRTALGWRTRRTGTTWEVERWNGTTWTPYARVASYDEARQAPQRYVPTPRR